MLNFWQRLAAALLGWQYACVRLNPGTLSEQWTVFRVYHPARGPSVIRLYNITYSRDTWIDGRRAVEGAQASWERLADYDYRPLTRGL